MFESIILPCLVVGGVFWLIGYIGEVNDKRNWERRDRENERYWERVRRERDTPAPHRTDMKE